MDIRQYNEVQNRMTIEERMNSLEARLGTQDALVKELRDFFTVSTYLQKTHSEATLSHANWLVRHDEAIQAHNEAIKAYDEAMKRFNGRISDVDDRILKLVSAMGEFISQNRR